MASRSRKFKDHVNNNNPNPCGIKWSDKVFDKIYWSVLPCYHRPHNIQLIAAHYFLIHYAQSSGTIEEWQRVIRILLLVLRDNNDDYILANEDPQKQPKNTLGRISSPENCSTVPKAMLPWYNSCVVMYNAENVRPLLTYCGCICLFLCKLIRHNYKRSDLIEHFKLITPTMQEHFGIYVNNGRATPPPSDKLFKLLVQIFTPFNPFAKEIICRLTQRRIEPHNKDIEKLQNVACYRDFMKQGSGVMYWLQEASRKLEVSYRELLDMLACIGQFGEAVEMMRRALTTIESNCQRSWQVCGLLRQSAYPEWAICRKDNQLIAVVLISIALEVSTKVDEIWKREYFKRVPKITPTVELGISIGQSIKRALASDKKYKTN